MNRKLSLLLSGLLCLGLVSLACSSGETVVDTGTAGTTGTSTGTAGTTGAAGTGTTGHAGTTGNPGTAGTSTTGTAGTGTTGTAGTTGRGGTTGTAGTSATGTAGRGGTTGTAGTSATGTAGTSGTGTAGTSGSTQCGSAFAVQNDGFVSTPSLTGCWSGYASAGGDASSTIMPKDFSMCGAGCMLKMTGTLGAIVGSTYPYAYLGFNVGQPSGGAAATTVTPTGTGIKVAFVNSSTASTLRVQLAADANGATSWCYTLPSVTASPVMIPYTSFTQMCYATPPGTAYAKQPIMSVQMNIPADSTSKNVNLTLTSVTEY
jgi:hypothetical protein